MEQHHHPYASSVPLRFSLLHTGSPCFHISLLPRVPPTFRNILQVKISIMNETFVTAASFRLSSLVRNWIAYADFLTMAAIAVTRSLGFILNHYNFRRVFCNLFSPKMTCCACILIWFLAFLILSPITFSLTIGNYYFGAFGYDVNHGKCEVLQCETSEGFHPGGFIFSIAFFVPFLFLLVSHIVVITVLELEKRRSERGILAEQSQVFVSIEAVVYHHF